MPLNFAPIGIEMSVVKCILDTELKKHLEDLGMSIGSKVKVIKEKDGDIILQIKQSRIAINKDLASKILVH